MRRVKGNELCGGIFRLIFFCIIFGKYSIVSNFSIFVVFKRTRFIFDEWRLVGDAVLCMDSKCESNRENVFSI